MKWFLLKEPWHSLDPGEPRGVNHSMRWFLLKVVAATPGIAVQGNLEVGVNHSMRWFLLKVVGASPGII
jgi:hypothetical protein